LENLLTKTSCSCVNEQLLQNTVLLRRFLRTMLFVRLFEQQADLLLQSGEMHGTLHMCLGEEAAAVGSVLALESDDYILVTHRGHGQAIAKGCDMTRMFAELLGKDGGTCRGRGGSMHIADLQKGVLAANGIVGANTAIACGAALSSQMTGKNNVTVVYLGDGAANQGVVHESMNLAAAWNLPLVFCIVDNGYGYSTPLARVSKETNLARRATVYGFPALECDGNDVLTVYETMRTARAMAQKGAPCAVVLHTYRTCGHSKSDMLPGAYRTQAEIDAWEAANPILRLKAFLREQDILSLAEIEAVHLDCERQVTRALQTAKTMPEPDAVDATAFVYA
jgi:Pyruvate/2-oxoglutarate dehydrogenase complex, dehydrogenase (E1) component, eukaryotic type, alpha subunit